MTTPVQPAHPARPPSPDFDYRITDATTAAQFNVPADAYLATQRAFVPEIKFSFLATGAVVFNRARTAVLLVQRAAGDSMPGLWETPGGAVDDEDRTVLAGVARELWEEAGLVAVEIGRPVPMQEGGRLEQVFLTRSGKVVGKYYFLVEVEDEAVSLDPNEHQSFVWASRDECLLERKGDVVLRFTTWEQKAAVMQAWKMIGEGGSEGK